MAEKYISQKTLALAEKNGFSNKKSLNKKSITQSELQTWFRKKHKIIIEPCYKKFSCLNADGYYCRIFKESDNCHAREYYCHIAKSKDYEQALERGLQETFKLI